MQGFDIHKTEKHSSYLLIFLPHFEQHEESQQRALHFPKKPRLHTPASPMIE
jgi:hypothetical protein